MIYYWLLALWNALPDIDKRRKVNRDVLIDQLWSAIEMLPDPEPQSNVKPSSKRDVVIAMLRQHEGATGDEPVNAAGWQRYTVRGASRMTVTAAKVMAPVPFGHSV